MGNIMKWVQRTKEVLVKNQKQGRGDIRRTGKRRREREAHRKGVSREKTVGGGRVRELRGRAHSTEQRQKVQKRVRKRRGQKRRKPNESVWEEERVRRGTGYRGSLESVQGVSYRKRDLGYGEPRRWKRPEGREVEVDKGTKRKRKATGVDSRERVMAAAVSRERRRPRSVYTGAGRSRKQKVGKRKLKSTKG